MPGPSRVWDQHHSSRQHWILYPLSEVDRDRTCNLMVPGRTHFHCAMAGTLLCGFGVWIPEGGVGVPVRHLLDRDSCVYMFIPSSSWIPLPRPHDFFSPLCFLGLPSWHMEVPKRGVESELRLLAYATGTAMWDPSRVCDRHHSSRHCLPDPYRPPERGQGSNPHPSLQRFLVGCASMVPRQELPRDGFFSRWCSHPQGRNGPIFWNHLEGKRR